jgi:hypothetical protein
MSAFRNCAIPIALLLLTACKSQDLVYQPRPDDMIDGRESALSAGVNTEMDWGPKQGLLLQEYKKVMNRTAGLEREVDRLKTENQTAGLRIRNESEAVAKERSLRVQAEAESESLRTKRRELEGRVLSLNIANAKLEQTALLSKIALLQKDLESLPPNPAEAAAPTAGK